MFGVIGITGQVGGATARHLLAQGKGVKALVRDAGKAAEWRSRGVELVEGDLEDADSVRRLFAGTEGAFAMTPPYMHAADPRSENRRAVTAIVEAAHETGLEKMVLLSSIGAQREKGTGAILKVRDAEQELFKLGLPVTAIRAAWFMENFAGLVPVAQQTGKLPSFLQPLDRVVPMIATEDIGALAAKLLTTVWSGKRVVELEGPGRYSAQDVAKGFAEVLGRTVEAEAVPREQWTAVYESWGLTATAANSMAEMMDGFNSDWVDFEGRGLEHVNGRTELVDVLRGLAKKG